jgi:hypothetical protein
MSTKGASFIYTKMRKSNRDGQIIVKIVDFTLLL